MKLLLATIAILILISGCSHNPAKESARKVASVSKDDIRKDGVKDFCTKTARSYMAGMIGTRKDDSGNWSANGTYTNFPSDEVMIQTIQQHPEQVEGGNPWQTSTYPDARVRETGYEYKLFSGDLIEFRSEAEIRDFLGDINYGVSRFFTKISDQVKGTDIATLLQNGPQQSSDINQSQKGLRVLCAGYNLLHSGNCKKALDQITTLMAPRENEMAIPVLAEVLADASYGPGAAIAALKIMDRVKQGDRTGNLMDDLQFGYRTAGLSAKDSEEHAWKLIAVWSTRGPNIYPLAPYGTDTNLHTLVALNMISSAAPYLDQLRIENGKNPYSYPTEVETTCSYGKPYHFWMSAFLARSMGIKLKDPKGAMIAAYLAEIGYQMRSATDGRDPKRAFTVGVFDTANNKLRVDVAFGAAGAVYGMRSASGQAQKTLSIDEAITRMLRAAKGEPTLSEADAQKKWEGLGIQGYLRWKTIFAPDEALHTFY